MSLTYDRVPSKLSLLLVDALASSDRLTLLCSVIEGDLEGNMIPGVDVDPIGCVSIDILCA